jgi:hypothetical protein
MHYNIPGSNLKLGPVSKFLTEMGVAKVDTQPSLKISLSGVPEDTRVVVLDCERS